MPIQRNRETDAELASRRWALVLSTLFAVGALAPGWPWAVMLAVPVLCGTLAVHRFEAAVLDRWLSSGLLLLADALLVGLAILGTTRARVLPFAGLFAVVLLASLVADRRKALLAGGALLVILTAVASAGPLPVFRVVLEDAVYLPLLIAAVFHFGYLAERLQGSSGREGAREGRSELWALLEITETITSTLDVSEVMHSIAERVGDLVDTPSCSILVVRDGSPDCLVLASKGHPEADMLELDLSKYPEIRQALKTRQPVMIDDVDTHPLIEPVRDVLLAKGYRSMLVIPLLFGREVVGALFLRSDRERPFPPSVLRFCKVAAAVSANALKNAMLYRDVKETGEKLRRILDGTPDMIVATDNQGRVTELNRGAETLTGWSAEQARDRPFTELLGGAELELRADDDTTPQEAAFSRRDGEKREVSLISAPLSATDEHGAGRVWIGRDVTSLRQAERSLVQADRLSSLGEVVAGVAHELNNPLSGVVGYAELLRANAGDPEQIRDLQRIVESAMRCQKIVFKLLSFARRQPPEKKYQSLNDCVTKVLDLKSYHLQSAQIATRLELDPDLPDTCFDLHQIEQVILNLLNNAEQAIQAIKRSGTIVVRTGAHEDQVYLEVQDDGSGVPEEERDRIFDPFFSTKDVGKGTGLGLSVSYGIIREHGGKIELRPVDSGACFRFCLPVVEGPGQPEPVETLEETPSAMPLRGRRILVAEDEPMVLELFARLLTNEGAEVTQTRDGQEAWERLAHESFDLVVTDLLMPNVDGQQLYEKVAEERPELLRRFVFATGDLMRQDTLSFLEGLPNRILTKPLEIETVRRVLCQALDAAA